MKAAPLALALLVAPGVGAQQQGATVGCNIDQGKPKSVATATYAVTAAQSTMPDKRAKLLQNAVKELTSGDQANPVGRNYLLGQVYMLWLLQPGVPPVAKRGDVGFSSNPTGTIDLLAAADSAFTAVETAMPQCVDVVGQARRQGPWQTTINAALAALNKQQYDSAQVYATRSMVIERRTPYAPYVLASVAQSKNDTPTALAMQRKALELSGTDTSYREIRRHALVTLGFFLSRQADAAKDKATRDSLAKESAQMLRTFLAEAPSDADAPVAQSTLTHVLTLSNDTTALASMYAEQLANPSKYSDLQLAAAGASAARANHTAEAVKLFEAALVDNPYNHDALNNLAATYYGRKEYDKMLPYARRLVALEPNNPDDWQLFSYAYGAMYKAAKGAAAKKAYNDSLSRYYTRAQKMPIKVKFTQFTRGSRATVGGTIENRGTAAKTYALTVEFLDKSGNVVAKKDTSVGPVAPKDTKNFSLTADQPNIVSFRYAPIE